MNPIQKPDLWEKLKANSPRGIEWLWLLIGALLLPWSFWQTVSPFAAWLAPIFLLRFTRTSKSRWTIWLVRLTYFGAIWFAHRGLPFNLLGFIGDIILKSAAWVLPYTIDRALSPRLGGLVRTLVFPAAFTTIDWLLSLTPLSTSGSLAYSQDGSLLLLQILSVTGMWGITFLIAWCASTINALWEQHFRLHPVRVQAGLFASLMAATLLFGAIRLFLPGASRTYMKSAMVTADAALISNATSTIDWKNVGHLSEIERAALRPKLTLTVDAMLARTKATLQGHARLVAWQESSGWVLEEDEPALEERAASLAKQYGAYIQISLEVFSHATSLPVLYNQSILIGPTGQVLWTYNKSHLVPYDEAFVTIPGNGQLPVVDAAYGRWSTATCYDTYFPALIRQAGKAGADLFIAPTNDVPQFAQSALSMADYRAIENGFTLLRPTGSGLSAIIDDHGRLVLSQDYSRLPSGILFADLPLHATPTLYSRIGDWLAYLSTAGLAAVTALAVLRHKPIATAAVAR